MNIGKSLLLTTLFLPVLAAASQILPVSEQEKNLLGIDVQAVTAVEQGGAGEITFSCIFVLDLERPRRGPSRARRVE